MALDALVERFTQRSLVTVAAQLNPDIPVSLVSLYDKVLRIPAKVSTRSSSSRAAWAGRQAGAPDIPGSGKDIPQRPTST